MWPAVGWGLGQSCGWRLDVSVGHIDGGRMGVFGLQSCGQRDLWQYLACSLVAGCLTGDGQRVCVGRFEFGSLRFGAGFWSVVWTAVGWRLAINGY